MSEAPLKGNLERHEVRAGRGSQAEGHHAPEQVDRRHRLWLCLHLSGLIKTCQTR